MYIFTILVMHVSKDNLQNNEQFHTASKGPIHLITFEIDDFEKS